jgi:hypothetical protein
MRRARQRVAGTPRVDALSPRVGLSRVSHGRARSISARQNDREVRETPNFMLFSLPILS